MGQGGDSDDETNRTVNMIADREVDNFKQVLE